MLKRIVATDILAMTTAASAQTGHDGSRFAYGPAGLTKHDGAVPAGRPL